MCYDEAWPYKPHSGSDMSPRSPVTARWQERNGQTIEPDEERVSTVRSLSSHSWRCSISYPLDPFANKCNHVPVFLWYVSLAHISLTLTVLESTGVYCCHGLLIVHHLSRAVGDVIGQLSLATPPDPSRTSTGTLLRDRCWLTSLCKYESDSVDRTQVPVLESTMNHT